jgi:hypothetical protein
MSMTEEFPVPEEISGYPIINYTRLAALPGEVPHLAIMVGRDIGRREERGYAVWDAAVRDGEWVLFSGAYDMSSDEARSEYNLRVHREFARRMPR